MNLREIGIDLGKTTFRLVGLNLAGGVQVRKKFSRSHYNIVGVALANKLARIAWAVLASGDAYRPPLLAGTTGLQMAAV